VIFSMGHSTSEINLAAPWIAMFIFVPLSIIMTTILVFIVLPLMGIHISLNDAVELFLYVCYSAIIMPIIYLVIYLGWKMVKQR
jgi:uncharacterized membrane protein